MSPRLLSRRHRGPGFLAPGTSPVIPGSSVSGSPVQLVLTRAIAGTLHDHLFRPDRDEHAAVIAAGWVRSDRGMRLLARELFLAEDNVEFVPGKTSHRRLTPAFVNSRIRHCRDEGLAYLAIHNHIGRGAVAFSGVDLTSHERGYPALLDIGRGVPVGALVLSENCLAGDVWMTDGSRHPVGETVILGAGIERRYPSPETAPAAVREMDDRGVRVYGAPGQALLGRLKVGIIGSGGVGMPLVSALSRLGVGHLVVVDPDKVEITNLPRLPESRRFDAMALVTAAERPAWMQAVGRRLAKPKARVAERIAWQARRDILCEGLALPVQAPAAARALSDCDYLFLAADSHTARALFNALVFACLIPGVQIGSRVEVGADGDLGDVFSLVRPVTPSSGCLWCNGLINGSRLTDEGLPASQREAQRYLPVADAPAPSVITLNLLGVGQAANHFMLAVTGLLRVSDSMAAYRRFEARSETLRLEFPRADAACQDCSTSPHGIFARGETGPLPTHPASVGS